jgi:hypothetical protein
VRIPFSEYQRRRIVPLAGLALVAYYFIVLPPLSHKSEKLDESVRTNWFKLSLSLGQTNVTAIDFLHITNQLTETRQALVILENVKQLATARLQLDPALNARINRLFVNDEYDSERDTRRNDLANLAKQAQVALDPTVLNSYPEYTFDVKKSSYLWAALSFTDSLLRTAVSCRVTAIQALEVPPVLTIWPPINSTERLIEIPLDLEFTSSAAGADKLLQYLPLRADEARAAGWTNAPNNKPVLFIDRLVVQKQSPEKLDEVHVWLRAVGFVLRE